MAVTVNASGQNLRSDYMISDAALSQRLAQQLDKAEKFEQMLAKVDEKMRKFADVKKAFDEGKFDVPTVEELKKAGIISDGKSASVKELAQKVASGEISVDEIPSDTDIPKLLEEIAALASETGESENPAAKPEKAENKEQKLFEGEDGLDEKADLSALAGLMSVDVSDEVADILGSFAAEDETVDAVTLDAADEAGIRQAADVVSGGNIPAETVQMETIPTETIPTETIPMENAPAENIPTETIPAENAPKADFTEQESAAAVGKTNVEDSAAAAVKVGGGAEQTQAEPSKNQALSGAADEKISANANVKAPDLSEAPRNETAQAETVRAAEVEAPKAAQVEAVKTVEAETAKAAETEETAPKAELTVQESAEAVAPKTAEAVKTEETAVRGEAAEVLKAAAERGEISKPEVKTQKAEKSDAQEEKIPFKAEESIPAKAVDKRAKALSEELEMLKNAKQKPETEPKLETAKALTAGGVSQSAAILRKDNGELLVVSQKELREQVQTFVEQVVRENREENEYSLMLNPEELGKITVKMTKAADGAVSVTIVAENARTQRLLEQNSELMQSNLKNSGINLESWQTVGESEQNHPAQDYSGSAKNPYYAQENNTDEETDENGKSFADIIAAM